MSSDLDLYALAYVAYNELPFSDATPVSGDTIVAYEAASNKLYRKDYPVPEAPAVTFESIGSGAVSTTIDVTHVLSTGLTNITLAACPSSMTNRIKTIQVLEFAGAVTLPLTNIVTSGTDTSAAFTANGAALTLLGLSDGNWLLLSTHSVTLS